MKLYYIIMFARMVSILCSVCDITSCAIFYRRGYIYGAVKGHHDAMFTVAVQSLDALSLVLTLKITLTLILT